MRSAPPKPRPTAPPTPIIHPPPPTPPQKKPLLFDHGNRGQRPPWVTPQWDEDTPPAPTMAVSPYPHTPTSIPHTPNTPYPITIPHHCTPIFLHPTPPPPLPLLPTSLCPHSPSLNFPTPVPLNPPPSFSRLRSPGAPLRVRAPPPPTVSQQEVRHKSRPEVGAPCAGGFQKRPRAADGRGGGGLGGVRFRYGGLQRLGPHRGVGR